MPILKHAKKKLRQDKKRTAQNRALKDTFKKLVKEARLKKTAAALSEAFSSVDKAAKNHLMHPNKAARLKASLTKVVEGKAPTANAPKKATTTKTKSSTAKGKGTTTKKKSSKKSK